MRRSAALLIKCLMVTCLAWAVPCLVSADTIYLKNGKTIVAPNVIEKNGRVTYETPSGTLSLPASIVDKVVHETFALKSPSGQPDAAAHLPIAPPNTGADSTDDGSRGIVINHSINLDLLARLEAEADSNPSASAIARVVAAERAAAQFDVSVGDFHGADSHYGMALRYAPDNLSALLDCAYLHLQRSEYSAALDLLEHARGVAPDSPDVAKLTGWAYYGLNRLAEAVKEWHRALALRPDAEVEHVLEKAQRDADEEANYREGESPHFQLHYNGDATPELARDILRTLETEFDEISTTLDYTPPASISVTLYTNQTFTDITRAPSWVGALNDGRIRIPVEGLSSVNDELARILKHELTHSFVTQKTNGHCPVWLQEGIAQYMEGARSGKAAARLVAAYDQHMDISLTSYESSWLNLPPDVAANAYAWSLAVVEAIVNDDGMTDLGAVLDHIAAQTAPEDAVRAVLHDSYPDLMQDTVRYLRKAYLN